MVKTKQQVIELLEENREKLKKFGVKRVGLFGSFVTDSQSDNSDIDLLVDFDKSKKSFQNFMSTIDFTENMLGRKVDLLTPESLSPYIAPHIQKEIKYVQIA